MNRLTVAVDIDDVLVDSADLIVNDYNQRYGTDLTRHDYYSKDITRLAVTHYDEAAARFRLFQESPVYTDAEPLAEAVESIGRLSDFCDFVGVTSRPEFIQAQTDEWVKRRFGGRILHVMYTSFLMGASDYVGSTRTKADVCRELKADRLVEDHLHYALPVAEQGTAVFLINQEWNQTDNLPRLVTRVQGWAEIEDKLRREYGL